MKNGEQKYSIEDVRNGKCAIENDGTVEELNRLVKEAKLQGCMLYGDDKFYWINNDGGWVCSNKTDLPTQSVKLFLSQMDANSATDTEDSKLGEEWQPKAENEFSPKWGEEVEMQFMKNWSPYKFLSYTLDRQMCILEDSDGAITQPMPLNRIRKPLEIHIFTTEQAKQDLAKLHNLNVNQIKIVE